MLHLRHLIVEIPDQFIDILPWRDSPVPANFCLLRLRRITWIITKREGVKSGRSGAHKPAKLGLSSKANTCSGTGTEDLSVLPTRDPSVMETTTLLAASSNLGPGGQI